MLETIVWNQIIQNTYTNLSATDTAFDSFMKSIEEYTDEPVHTLAEMKERRSTKRIGDIFEMFCKQYMSKVYPTANVWLLCEVPEEILIKLNLTRHDVGIDMIINEDETFMACQCKYKGNKQYVTWKELSTFYALCARSPILYKYQIVMTTGLGVRRN